ncbi:MAG: endonuclease/exonuclease/phosphatase family protein, partial [Gemmatimonadales bacterium]
MRYRAKTTLMIGLVAGAACRTGANYAGTWGPRYAGGAVAPRLWGAETATIRVVTFNIQFARHIDSALALLETAEQLAGADIITLQEMDAPGTSRIAAALGMSYVYYPATHRSGTGRDFGNAILSRWPISEDRKIILPHLGRFAKTLRTATAATIAVAGVPVWVYSVHLGTIFELSPGAKRDQARAIIADAAAYPRVIVCGDMNSHGIGREFRAAGYGWPTEHNPRTKHFWNWDHVFLKGLELRDTTSTGVVRDNRHASDHRPVWA